MATIRRRGDKYQAAIFVGKDANGKNIMKYITCDGEKECKKAARKIEVEIQDGKNLGNEKMHLKAYMEKWIELHGSGMTSASERGYRLYIDNHLSPALGHLKLGQINEMHVREYIKTKLDEGISPTTVRKHFYILSKMLKSALKQKNPCLDIKPPKANDYEPKVYTTEEFERLHDIVKGTWDELPILLAGWGGLRLGEVFALKTSDILYKEGKIKVFEAQALQREGAKYELKSPKSKKGFRTVALSDELMTKLKNHATSIKTVNIKNAKKVMLFDMRPDSYSKRFQRILEENNLPKTRFHDLRHYHATILYRNGVPDHYAAQRLGHDVLVLKRVYQHLQLDQQEILDDQVRDIFSNNPVKKMPEDATDLPH